MSSIQFQANASGTGVFTFISPNSNTNRSLSLPDEAGTVITSGTTSGINATAVTTGTLPKARLPAGSVVQSVYASNGSMTTTAAIIPGDDTIPQITEGTEYMTATITPTSATNALLIQVTMMLSNNGPNYRTIALFQDSTANALAAVGTAASANWPVVQTFTHRMIAGTTSATTFRVRFGTDTGTVTVSGVNGGRLWGGVISNSIMITEVVV